MEMIERDWNDEFEEFRLNFSDVQTVNWAPLTQGHVNKSV